MGNKFSKFSRYFPTVSCSIRFTFNVNVSSLFYLFFFFVLPHLAKKCCGSCCNLHKLNLDCRCCLSPSVCLSDCPTVRVAAVLSFCQLIDCQRLRMAFINSHFCIIIMRKQHSARLAYKFPLTEGQTDRGTVEQRQRTCAQFYFIFICENETKSRHSRCANLS